MEFRWNEWNTQHATRHGVRQHEAEEVVRSGRPEIRGDGKYLIRGRGSGGRWIQVIYVLDDDGGIYVIHARSLTEREKRRIRRGGP